jgi:hypothetical protein
MAICQICLKVTPRRRIKYCGECRDKLSVRKSRLRQELLGDIHKMALNEIIQESAAKRAESAPTKSNNASTSCLGCANSISDHFNGANFVCRDCSLMYANKWVA